MDTIRSGAPPGQIPPSPPPAGNPPPPGNVPLLPAPQGGAIAVIDEQMAQRLARLMALASTREFARLGMKVEWNAERPDILERARAAADEMYGSIMQTAGQRVKDFFADQLAEGKAPPDIAKALQDQFQGVSGRQARMVARTVTRQLYNEAALDAYEAAGVREVIASDGHGGLTGKTDAGCLARNGKTFTIDEARLEEHSPTTHPNAVMQGTPILAVGGVRSAFAAAWVGPVVTIITRRGSRITLGPNHPVLTTRGWVPADHVREGDHVLRRLSQIDGAVHHLNLDQRQARAEDVFDAARHVGTHSRVVAAASQFHGDGNFCQGEVEVVRAESLLLDVSDPQIREVCREAMLERAGVDEGLLACAGSSGFAFGRVNLSAASGVRGTDIAGIGVAVSDRDAGFDQPLPQDGLTDASLPCEWIDRFAGLVALDEVIEIRDHEARCQAYDLHTGSGTYWADGILLHNCTLSWRPVVPDEGLRSEDEASQAVFSQNGHGHLLLVWEPEKHPRWPRGTPRVGGEWMDTDNVIAMLRAAPGRRDLSFLARGAQRVRSVFGSARGDGADLHVEMRDGSSHTIHVPAGSRWADAVRVLGALDTARPSAAPSGGATGVDSAATEIVQPGPNRTLSSLAAGARFHAGGVLYERVTQGDSKRGDGRLTVRNVSNGKRVHMMPGRLVTPQEQKPPVGEHAKVSDLKPGDRFQVADRVYELLPQGGARRRDGRITGRELATGKRVHFKPDRVVLRTAGDGKPPAPPPPPPPKLPPPPKPPKIEKPPKPPAPPPVELPPEYANLPLEGEDLGHYIGRISLANAVAPPGYVFARIPKAEWLLNQKTIRPPEERYGRGRIYGHTNPARVAGGSSDSVLVLVERQRGVNLRYSRDYTHGFASISRKNIVAAWQDAPPEIDAPPPDRAQLYYRAPSLPAEKPTRFVTGKRYTLGDIPGGDAHFIVYDGKRYQIDQAEKTRSVDTEGNVVWTPTGKTRLFPLNDQGAPMIHVPRLVDSGEKVTYGLPQQKPIPAELIRATEEMYAGKAGKGETVRLDDGFYYTVTGARRRGDLAGLELRLFGGGRAAPVTRIPFDTPLHVVKFIQRDGAVTRAQSLLPGDTFRTSFGKWEVTGVERVQNSIEVKAKNLESAYQREPGFTSTMQGSSSVQVGLAEATPQGGRYLWEYKPGDHVHQGGHGYELIGRDSNGFIADNVQTGRSTRLHAYAPDWKPGLPEGQEPLPPRVQVPGTRARDLKTGERFTYRGQLYEMSSYQPETVGPRGSIKAAKVVDGQRYNSVEPIPDSALVVRDGEKDPYGTGKRRRKALLAKAREIYQSRRSLQTEAEIRDAGALIHEAIGQLAAPSLETRTSAETPAEYRARRAREQAEHANAVRAAISEIRPFAEGTFTVRGAGARTIHDHDSRPAIVRDPTPAELAQFQEAHTWFPQAWIDEVERDGGTNVTVGVDRGFYRNYGLAAGQDRLIAVKHEEDQATVQHEMGHRVEHAFTRIKALSTEFWQRRTAGESTTLIYRGRDEQTKEDRFVHRYMGKLYGMQGGGEIFSMGIEDLAHPYGRVPDGASGVSAAERYSLIEADADYAHFMLGLLAALKTDAEIAQIEQEQKRLSGS